LPRTAAMIAAARWVPDMNSILRNWLVISLAVLAAASVAGCGAFGGATASPSASMMIAGVPLQAPSGRPEATEGACVTSAAKGVCGPYADSDAGLAGGNFAVGQDVWNPIRGWSQDLHVTTPADNIGVISYPDVGETLPSHVPLSNFSAIYSSFAEDMHATLDTKAWAAYDVWLNNWKNEILIQNDYVDHGGCSVLATATFGGAGGVPVQKWNLCRWGGSEIIWWLTGDNEQSGAVDILAMVNWLIGRGYLPERSDLDAVSYGWEICSTGGKPETFTISRFTVTAYQNSARLTRG
jgi:hypothetical protein